MPTASAKRFFLRNWVFRCEKLLKTIQSYFIIKKKTKNNSRKKNNIYIYITENERNSIGEFGAEYAAHSGDMNSDDEEDIFADHHNEDGAEGLKRKRKESASRNVSVIHQ
jgi:hypothetical protein